MKNVLIVGAGNIGKAIGYYLSPFVNAVYFKDDDFNTEILARNIIPNGRSYYNGHKIDLLINCAPIKQAPFVMRLANSLFVPYLDLGGDDEMVDIQKTLPVDIPIIPSCGLAPGLMSILAYNLHKKYQTQIVSILCGGITPEPDAKIGWALTWSTKGLIINYTEPASYRIGGKTKSLASVANLDFDHLGHRIIGKNKYESYPTHGGLGNLLSLLPESKVGTVIYETLRHPGHFSQVNRWFTEAKLKTPEMIPELVVEDKLVKFSSKGPDKIVGRVGVGTTYVSNFIVIEELGKDGFSAMQRMTAIPTAAIARIVLNDQYKWAKPGFNYVETVPIDPFLFYISEMGLHEVAASYLEAAKEPIWI